MFLYSGVPGALPHLPSSVVCTGLSRFSAAPLAVQSMEAPAARVVAGQVTATPWSSVTRTLFKVTLPVLVTRLVQNTVLPIAICGASPALGSLASALLVKPLVAPVTLTILIAGAWGTTVTDILPST